MTLTPDTPDPVRTLCAIVESDHAWHELQLAEALAAGRRAGYDAGYRAGYEAGLDDDRRRYAHLSTWTPPDLPTLEQACRRASERPELVDLALRIADDPRITDDELDEVIAAVVARRTATRGGKAAAP